MERSILILDEDKDYCNLLNEIFSQAGYRVNVAKPSWNIADKLQELEPSIVVLDYRFGNQKGVDLVRLVHDTRASIKVIVASDTLAEQTIRALIEVGIDGLFTKPLKPISFLKRASDLLSETSIQRPEHAALLDAPDGFVVSGFQISSFPGRSQISRRFAEKLVQVRGFKSRLLLVGEEGAPFRLVAHDLVKEGMDSTDALIFFEKDNLEFSGLAGQAAQLKDEGFTGLVITLLDAEQIADEDTAVIRQIQAPGGLADQWGLNVRFIFCLREELDILYDKSLISTNVYMTLGATELRIPRLRECVEDIPLLAERMLSDLCDIRELTTIPHLDESAKAYLREFPWKQGFDELNVVLDRLLERAHDEVISAEHFPAEDGQAGEREKQTPLKRYLLQVRDEYVEAVIELCGGDLGRAADSLMVSEGDLRGWLKR